jgi:hypothetical protein
MSRTRQSPPDAYPAGFAFDALCPAVRARFIYLGVVP